MQEVATAMHTHLASRDQVQNERISRFEPLVETLTMSGEEFYILPLLLSDYLEALRAAPHSKKHKSEQKKKSNKPRNSKDKKRRGDDKRQKR